MKYLTLTSEVSKTSKVLDSAVSPYDRLSKFYRLRKSAFVLVIGTSKVLISAVSPYARLSKFYKLRKSAFVLVPTLRDL